MVAGIKSCKNVSCCQKIWPPVTRGWDDRVCLGVKIDRINIIMAVINVPNVPPYRISLRRTILLQDLLENQRTIDVSQ